MAPTGPPATEPAGLTSPDAEEADRSRCPRLRRDAQRNREAVLSAARQVFAEQGLEAPLEEIARRAGVGIATLYRRFPTRLDLVDAIVTDAIERHVVLAQHALAMPDPWAGFVYYLEESGRLQAADRGTSDMMSMRVPRATRAEEARVRLFKLTGDIIRRAQDSGQLRPDVTQEDLAFVVWANTRIIEATQAVVPQAWRRGLALMLDGFRAERANDLPVPAMTPRQVFRAMLTLGRRCTGGSA